MPTTLRPVSWQRMSDAIENVRRRLLRAAAALDAAQVPYAIVGDNAVAAWVSRADEAAVRNTRDVDILLRREDLPAAIVALEKAGFPHRRIASLGQAGAKKPASKFREQPSPSFPCTTWISFRSPIWRKSLVTTF